MKREETKLFPQFSVVALLGFFQPMKMRLQGRVLEEGRSVDPLHRLVLRVAFPVGVRAGEHLERFEMPGGRHVRSRTEIDEGVFDRVARHHRSTLLVDQLNLERLPRSWKWVIAFSLGSSFRS